MIPKRPSSAHTICAKNTVDFKIVDGVRKPIIRWFTQMAWNEMPSMNVDKKDYPKQGFVQIDPENYIIPEEAQAIINKETTKELSTSEIEAKVRKEMELEFELKMKAALDKVNEESKQAIAEAEANVTEEIAKSVSEKAKKEKDEVKSSKTQMPFN